MTLQLADMSRLLDEAPAGVVGQLHEFAVGGPEVG